MKKAIFCDFTEYNSPTLRLGNYHYCNCFVKDGYEVLWMSNAYNLLIYFKDKEDYYFKKSISSAERHPLAERVYGYAPYSLRLYGNYPLSKNPKIIEHFPKYIVPNITKSLEKMRFSEVDVLWISNPKAYWLTNVVKYKKLIYRMADDYSKFAEFPNIERIEELLIKKADDVIVSASTLEEKVQKYGKKPLVLSNAVLFEHFNQEKLECPPEYLQRNRKRIIYVGAIKSWFDIDLVRKIAEQLEDDIYLIGKCETDLSVLKKYKNVHILGARSYDRLPAYMQHADVALIPFIKNSMTDSISPLKLYEYCSAGVGVVSTYLAETVKLNAPICLAENHEAFITGVKSYLDLGYDRTLLIEFGRQNSWNKRYEQMKKEFLI